MNLTKLFIALALSIILLSGSYCVHIIYAAEVYTIMWDCHIEPNMLWRTYVNSQIFTSSANWLNQIKSQRMVINLERVDWVNYIIDLNNSFIATKIQITLESESNLCVTADNQVVKLTHSGGCLDSCPMCPLHSVYNPLLDTLNIYKLGWIKVLNWL